MKILQAQMIVGGGRACVPLIRPEALPYIITNNKLNDSSNSETMYRVVSVVDDVAYESDSHITQTHRRTPHTTHGYIYSSYMCSICIHVAALCVYSVHIFLV